ncbi:hypothetical protein SAMD00019534_080390, partial [Acytostelium subglobosum LB1]|uniref:hypothetical protein n=1 Tax=Acytostelium subglobosum LB1 TaxID=1410327 RepID=UPI0006451FF5
MMMNNEYNNLKKISIIEAYEHLFDDAVFWENIKDFMNEMYARSVSMYFSASKFVSYSMYNVPLTKMEIGSGLSEFSILPRTLTKLVLRRGIYESLNGLPDSLTCLVIGCAGWNMMIKPGTLPPRLKKLVVSNAFDQPIAANTFPPTLECVQFGKYFNQPLDNLPTSVTKLSLGDRYRYPIGNKHLVSFHHKGNAKFTSGVIFNALTHLKVQNSRCYWDTITSSAFPSLIKLNLSVPEQWTDPIDFSSLPASLEALTIDPNGPVSAIPQGLKKLYVVGSMFPITNSIQLPPSLHSLAMRDCQTDLMDAGRFPSTLTSLTITMVMQVPHLYQLPPSLRSLCLQMEMDTLDNSTIDRLEEILAATSLVEISLFFEHPRGAFNHHLHRITHTLFITQPGNTILEAPNDYGFISADTIMSMIKVHLIANP